MAKNTVWETLAKVIETGLTRILLWGPPGTGKTTFGFKHAEAIQRDPYGITITNDSAAADLLGYNTIRGGNFEYREGPAVKALKAGGVLILNEITDASPAIEPTLMAILDDPSIRSVPLPTGEEIKGKPETVIIASMNDSPDGLRDALRDRFDVCLYIGVPHDGALSKLTPETRGYTVSVYEQRKKPETAVPDVSLRRMLALDRLAPVFGLEESVGMIFGTEAVDDFVTAYTAIAHERGEESA